jgi:hypothetical protein
MRLAQAIISRDPGAQALCEKASPFGPILRSEADRGPACALIIQGSSPESRCPRITALWKPGNDQPVQHCPEALGMLMGDAKYCTEKSLVKTLCKTTAAYKQAFAAKDPKLCGGNHECRWMMGGPSSCQTYADDLKKHYCEVWVREKIKSDIGALQVVETQIHKEALEKAAQETAPGVLKSGRDAIIPLLTRADELIESIEPKSLPGIKARRDKLARTRLALDQLDKPYRGSGKKE